MYWVEPWRDTLFIGVTKCAFPFAGAHLFVRTDLNLKTMQLRSSYAQDDGCLHLAELNIGNFSNFSDTSSCNGLEFFFSFVIVVTDRAVQCVDPYMEVYKMYVTKAWGWWGPLLVLGIPSCNIKGIDKA